MKRRACIVSQRQFPGDSRLMTEVRSLLDSDYAVDMICMAGSQQSLSSFEEGVRIFRIPSMQRRRAGKVRYVAEYVTFFIPTFWLLTLLQFIRGYQVVHITNLPDALLWTATISKLVGAKLIFDVRECTPEMFMDRFGALPGSSVLRLMTAIEQACLKFADATVTCTEQMRQALISRGAQPEKISVILNMPSDNILCEAAILPDLAHQADDAFRIVTHGTIIPRYGHDLLIDAMAEVVRQVPQAHLEIFGRGEILPKLERQIAELGLENSVTLAGFVSNEELIAKLRQAHCGVVPLLKNPESDLVHTFKMYEYIHLGIPLVISRTSAVAAYFDDQSVRFFEPGSVSSLAEALIDMSRDPVKRFSLALHALHQYENYSPTKQQAIYAALVGKLTRLPTTAMALEVEREN